MPSFSMPDFSYTPVDFGSSFSTPDYSSSFSSFSTPDYSSNFSTPDYSSSFSTPDYSSSFSTPDYSSSFSTPDYSSSFSTPDYSSSFSTPDYSSSFSTPDYSSSFSTPDYGFNYTTPDYTSFNWDTNTWGELSTGDTSNLVLNTGDTQIATSDVSLVVAPTQTSYNGGPVFDFTSGNVSNIDGPMFSDPYIVESGTTDNGAHYDRYNTDAIAYAVAPQPQLESVPLSQMLLQTGANSTATGDGIDWAAALGGGFTFAQTETPAESTMSYADQMANVYHFFTDAPIGVVQQIIENPRDAWNNAVDGVVGLGKGIPNFVTETATQTAIGLRYLTVGGAELVGLASPGALDGEIAQYRDFTGRLFEYDNSAQAAAGFVSGFATPGLAAKGVAAATDLVSAARTSMAIESGTLGAMPGYIPSSVSTISEANVAGAHSLAAPWLDEVSNMTSGGTFLQCGGGSCVSATAQNITNGVVTETEIVSKIGEWSNSESLARELNNTNVNGGGWIGGMVSEADTLRLANSGVIGAELQVAGQAAHMVAISPIAGSP